MDHRSKEWFKAQTRVGAWLHGRGVSVRTAGYYAPFDLITDGNTRIEVKFAELRPINPAKNLGWAFNIHRHGKVSNGSVDFYIFRCEMGKRIGKLMGFSNAIHLVIPSPIDKTVIAVSLRSLIRGQWAQYLNNPKAILEFEKRKNGSEKEVTA